MDLAYPPEYSVCGYGVGWVEEEEPDEVEGLDPAGLSAEECIYVDAESRGGLAGTAASWLLDAVLGRPETDCCSPRVSQSASTCPELEDEPTREETRAWLQPLSGSASEEATLQFMHMSGFSARTFRAGSWQSVADELLPVAQAKLRLLFDTEVVKRSCVEQWLQKLVMHPHTPQQLRQWGQFVLSPSALDPIRENVEMAGSSLKYGLEHYAPPDPLAHLDLAGGPTSAPRRFVRRGSAPACAMRRSAKSYDDLAHLS